MTKLINTPFADTGDKTDIPLTDASGKVNWTQGFPGDYSKDPDTDPSAKRIERDDFNGLINFITAAIREIQVNGVAPFIEAADNGGVAFSYGLGVIVIKGGKVYQSLKAGNTDAVTVAASWSEICTVAKLNTEVAKYAFKGGDASQGFAVAAAGSNTGAVNLGQMNAALAGKADLAGNTAQKFWVQDAPGDNNTAATVGRLNYVASLKASLNGDANVDFYCRNNGNGTAAVNNDRLNFVLGSYALLDGNQNRDFKVAGGTTTYSAVAAWQFQSGNNNNGAWVMMPRGAMWCRHNLTLNANGLTTWTFPATFPSAPAVFITAVNGSFRAWLTGIGPQDCGMYNDGPALNVNLLAIY